MIPVGNCDQVGMPPIVPLNSGVHIFAPSLSSDFVCLSEVLFSLPQSYLALPKGGLVAEHVLVLPIGHYGATTDAPVVRLVISSLHLLTPFGL